MRFPAIPEAEWTAEQRAVADRIIEGPRGQLRGPFIPLLNSPGLAGHVQDLGAFLRFETAFARDLIEIGVLMTARHFDCGYIWRSHRPQAVAAGVGDGTIAAIGRREDGIDAGEPQHFMVLVCRELLETNRLSDGTFDRALAMWGRPGVMELAGLVGYYALLSMVLNTSADSDERCLFE